MSLAILASVAAYLLTSVCAITLVRRRGPNRHLRLLTVVIGLLPLVQVLTLLRDRALGDLVLFRQAAENIDLVMAYLCLFAIYLIDRESRDRRRTDMQLRLAEQERAPQPAPPPSALVHRAHTAS